MTEQEWLTSNDPQAMLRVVSPHISSMGHASPFGSTGLRPISDRKLRLFACGCARQVWHLLTDERSRRAVEVAERYADGAATSKERGLVFNAADGLRGDQQSIAYGCLRANAADGAIEACFHARQCGASAADLAALLRDIAGNPFRIATRHNLYLTGDPDAPASVKDGNGEVVLGLCRDCGKGESELSGPCRWLTPTVLSLAHAAYDERAGRDCDDAECRGRGKWADAAGDACECGACHGTGRIDDGSLDPVRLAILADALEEASCNNREILDHLRNNAVHVRGCWVLDLVLGKE